MELSGTEGRRLLEEVAAEASLPAAAESWRALARALNELKPEHPARDRALAACFVRLDASPERASLIETALLALCWPILEAVHNTTWAWEADPDTRWSEVLYAFLRAIRRFSLERRSGRISGKVYNDIRHDLYLECSKRWKIDEREITHTPAEMIRIAENASREADIPVPDRRDVILDFLGRYRQMGVIDGVEMDLLMAVLADGMTVKEAAARIGLSPEAGKKRKQRAETAIAGAARQTC